MGELMKRVSHALTTPIDSDLPRRLVWDVQRAVDAVAAQAIVRAAEVQADGYVGDTCEEVGASLAHVGMRRIAILSAEEGLLIQQVPLAEPRLKAIVDTYAGLVAHEVAKLGYKR